jgi:nucleoside-diphosphate-sugar epimerase
MIIRACGSKSRIEYTARRPWDNSARREADISHASTTLGFRPQVAVAQGIERNVAWFRENRERIAEAARKEGR